MVQSQSGYVFCNGGSIKLLWMTKSHEEGFGVIVWVRFNFMCGPKSMLKQ